MSRELAAYETEIRVRTAAFAFLDSLMTRLGGIVRLEDVSQFEYMGERMSLLDPQRGIRKPRQMLAALSIRTVHSTDPRTRPYADDIGADGYLRYKWRGTDPDHPENRALRDAMILGLPLIWFQGVGPGAYVPIYPVWLAAEEALQHEFVVALDESQVEGWNVAGPRRVAEEPARYEPEIVNRRLHQPVFRGRVILAYQRQCALCHLRHVELLDAAHIKGDAEGGQREEPEHHHRPEEGTDARGAELHVGVPPVAHELRAHDLADRMVVGERSVEHQGVASDRGDASCLEPGILMKRTIPAAALVVFPNTGHALNLEEPALFNQSCADFFHQVESGRWPRRDPRSVTGSILGMR